MEKIDNCLTRIIRIMSHGLRKINISIEVYTYKLLSTLTVSNQSENKGQDKLLIDDV